MKILMISTFPHGGATIAARRQKEALREAGHECSLLCVRQNMGATNTTVEEQGDEIRLVVPASVWSYGGRITTAYTANNRTDHSNTWFSFWPCETSFDDEILDLCLKFDVIHFHWISQMVSSRLLNSLVRHKRKIVVTGHDMNHFTGGCHYSAGCENYIDNCDRCPHLKNDPLKLVENSFNNKLNTFLNLNPRWIFPSLWLEQSFKMSRLGTKVKKDSSTVLYNCIDTNKFVCLAANERIDKRSAMGISHDEVMMVAGAADNSELRKGFDYIESGIKKLSSELRGNNNENKRFILITFGRGRPAIHLRTPYIRHLHLGEIDECQVKELLQISDLLLFPSVEENFSNLILESLMCGCPVLAFKIGGVPDIIEHKINGWVVDQVSHHEYGEMLVSLFKEDCLGKVKSSAELWRQSNFYKYSYKNIASELVGVYSEIILNSTNDQLVNVKKNHYNSLFSSVSPNHTNSHSVLAANIERLVQTGERNTARTDDVTKIEALYGGVTDMVKCDPFGRVCWWLQNSYVVFKAQRFSRPGLMLVVPNYEWVPDLVNLAFSKLGAALNGVPAKTVSVKSEKCSRVFYIWIIPTADSINYDGLNILKLDFSEPSVSLDRDPGGLSILCNSYALLDISSISDSQRDNVPDYKTSRALALTSTQDHYIWGGLSEKVNETYSLHNDVETWVDMATLSNLTVSV